jgi:hypothetical protein
VKSKPHSGGILIVNREGPGASMGYGSLKIFNEKTIVNLKIVLYFSVEYSIIIM